MLAKTNAELVLCFLTVKCMNSATVTVANGNLTYTKTGATTEFNLPRIGTWTITATFNGLTQVRSVTLAGGQSQTVTFPSDIYLYNRGSYAEGFTHGWSIGEGANEVNLVSGGATTLSTGRINLTGISTVKFEYKITIGAAGGASGAYMIAELWVTDANGSNLKCAFYQRVTTWDKQWQGTATLDVSDVNQVARFAMTFRGYGERNGKGHLYSVRVIK